MTTDPPSSDAAGQRDAAGLGLRGRLKHATRDLHRQAQRSGIMQRLLLGRIERPGYGALLRNLHEIYAGLETALEARFEHPLLAPILFRALFRRANIESDLRFLHGDRWAEEIAVLPAAASYRARLDEISSAEPALLVAHAYVRYLGDLSDGQIVYQLVAERLGLGEAGSRFYQFGSAEDIDVLVARFRAGLDAIPADATEVDRIADEAQRALRLHIDLYEQLAG